MVKATADYSISLTDTEGLGNARQPGAPLGVLVTLLNKQMRAKLRRGDAATMDYLWNLTDSHPTTKKLIAASFYSITQPADEIFGQHLRAVSKTLEKAPSSMPKDVLQSGGHSVQIKGMGSTPALKVGWDRLSDYYLMRLKLMTRMGRTKGSFSAKTFWNERGRAGSKARGSGPPMHTAASEYFLGLSRPFLQDSPSSAYKSRTISKSGRGRDNRFTIGNAERSGRNTFHGGANQHAPSKDIYGVEGDLLFPARLTGGNNARLNETFTLTLIKSLATGNDVSVDDYLSKNDIMAEFGDPDNSWEARLLLNEMQRPWITKLFARRGKNFRVDMQRILAQKGGRNVKSRKPRRRRSGR